MEYSRLQQMLVFVGYLKWWSDLHHRRRGQDVCDNASLCPCLTDPRVNEATRHGGDTPTDRLVIGRVTPHGRGGKEFSDRPALA